MTLDNNKTDLKTFNLGSGVNYSIIDIYNLICGMLDKNIEPIYKDSLPFEANETLADIKLSKSIGWGPEIDLKQGLSKFIDYVKKNLI